MPDHLPFRRKSGRPSPGESERRTREFVRLLAAGETFADAQRQSGIAAARVLRLLDEPAFRAIAVAALEQAA